MKFHLFAIAFCICCLCLFCVACGGTPASTSTPPGEQPTTPTTIATENTTINATITTTPVTEDATTAAANTTAQTTVGDNTTAEAETVSFSSLLVVTDTTYAAKNQAAFCLIDNRAALEAMDWAAMGLSTDAASKAGFDTTPYTAEWFDTYSLLVVNVYRPTSFGVSQVDALTKKGDALTLQFTTRVSGWEGQAVSGVAMVIALPRAQAQGAHLSSAEHCITYDSGTLSYSREGVLLS